MTEPELIQTEPTGQPANPFRNLRELVDFVAGKSLPPLTAEEGRVTESLPFPFLGIVGQQEMKLALLLGLINPNVGGILLIGPRGTAKTTAVRSLLDLLPQVERSTCSYGCLPEDIEIGGIGAVCPECAKKYGEEQPLTAPDKVRLIELPLNSKLEDVVGGIDERAAAHERMRVRRGILALADRNLLYIDEINLLGDDIVDSILDAAAPTDPRPVRAARDRARAGRYGRTAGSLSKSAGVPGKPTPDDGAVCGGDCCSRGGDPQRAR